MPPFRSARAVRPAARRPRGSRTGLRYVREGPLDPGVRRAARGAPRRTASAVAGTPAIPLGPSGGRTSRVQQRRGGQVGDRERVADEVLAAVELLLEPVEAFRDDPARLLLAAGSATLKRRFANVDAKALTPGCAPARSCGPARAGSSRSPCREAPCPGAGGASRRGAPPGRGSRRSSPRGRAHAGARPGPRGRAAARASAPRARR